MMDMDAIRAANPLSCVAGAQVRLRRAGSEWKGCCPFHSDKTPSFTIFDGGERFHCFGCGASGDVLDYVQRLHDVSLPEAARMLGAGEMPRLRLPPGPPADKRGRSDEARAIWEGATGAAESLAETYLRARGILLPPPSCIRFSWLSVGRSLPMPCLVAGVRNVLGQMAGIQRIFLKPDGSGKADILKPKLSLGRIAGGAIRFGIAIPGEVLTVCEGPEDGLSLVQMFGRPVWASAGASFLPLMQFPEGIRHIVIAADNDTAGRSAAAEAACAFARRGLEVRVIRPQPGFKDFNDELMKGAR